MVLFRLYQSLLVNLYSLGYAFSLILFRVLSEVTAIDHDLLVIQVICYICMCICACSLVCMRRCVCVYVLCVHIYNVYIKHLR